MRLNPIISLHSYLSLSFSILFLYQTIINFFVAKTKAMKGQGVKSHLALCAFSTLYAFIAFLMVWQFSLQLNIYLLHLMWICGSLITYFYIGSVKAYLADFSENLKIIRMMPLISAAGALVAFLLLTLFNINIFIDPVAPVLNYRNLYMQSIGGLNPHNFVKALSAFALVPTIYSSIYFLNLIYKSKTRNRILALGIFLTLFAVMNDVCISFIDPLYLVPLMFLANIFEISRITFANQLALGKRLHELTFDLIQSNKLTEAGVYYAALAHEILSPLQAVKGYLHMIMKKKGKENADPNLQRYVELISKQLLKIENLAINVRKFTKIGSKEGFIPADLQTIIQDSIDTIQVKATHSGVVISYHPLANVQINCLQDQLVQVITNLLNNSIEAIADHEEKWIRIDHKQMDGSVLISVLDSGKGILLEIQDQIWENRFTTKKVIGAGLGLNICKEIIRNHDGDISLNTESKNTEFIIQLPAES